MARRNRKSKSVQLFSLGGVGEIGKNMYVLTYGRQGLIMDAGLKFPDESMLGVDIVIPDISHLLEQQIDILGIILTHGHEDHIGAMPYLLDDLSAPVYGTGLTLGLLKAKLSEHPGKKVTMREIGPDSVLELSENFRLEFFRTNHSIPDAVGVSVDTPVGTIVYTSDFKFDQTPVDGRVTDYHRLTELGRKGVLATLIDCTNADRPGYTLSERKVGESISEIFRLARGRILLATFASNIHRIQQVVDAAALYDRRVCVVGRSVVDSVDISSELGYLDIPDGVMVDLERIRQVPPEKLVLITTGSQGEPMSALSRIARSDHRQVQVMAGDTVIIAANPIPGNEKLVARTVNNLFQLGAEVIYGPVSGVHVSGHASQEELKMMLNLLKPAYVIPVHGEYRQQAACRKLAMDLGILEENVFMVKPGQVMEFQEGRGRVSGSVPAARVLVDGFGIGDVGEVVIRDRQLLSEDGIVIITLAVDPRRDKVRGGPEIATRGFVYVKEADDLLEGVKLELKPVLEQFEHEKRPDYNRFKSKVKDAAASYFYDQTGRRPVILPVLLEV